MIKISLLFQSVAPKKEKNIIKVSNIGCIDADFWGPMRNFKAFSRILPECGEFRQNSAESN